MLYRQAEERARAAGCWTPSATASSSSTARGRRALEPAPPRRSRACRPRRSSAGRRRAIPGWETIAARAGRRGDRAVARPETVPLELGGRELWLSISGVGFADGTVYAFRDLTEERALEELKADFVSTVSHELRTPLAAVYGAAHDARRDDVALDDGAARHAARRDPSESERLRDDRQRHPLGEPARRRQLDASRSRAATPRRSRERRDRRGARAPARRTSSSPSSAPDDLPPVAGRPGQDPPGAGQPRRQRDQVLARRRPVEVALSRASASSASRCTTRASASRRRSSARIFEKFYRLDPNLTRGVGGTGLGLYICRELVHRMDGRSGSTPRARQGLDLRVRAPRSRATIKAARRRAQGQSPGPGLSRCFAYRPSST